MHAVVGNRRLTPQHLTDEVDDLTGPRKWLRERLAVPALDHLRPGDAQTEHHPTPGEVVEGHAGIAIEVGARADICTPRCPDEAGTCAPHHASGVNASEPHASAVKTESKPTRPAPTSAPTPSGGCAPQYPSCSPNFMGATLGRTARDGLWPT